MKKLFFIFLGISGLTAGFYLTLPGAGPLITHNPSSTAFIETKCQSHECPIDWIRLEKISPMLVKAVLLAEDPRFFEHNGFDWKNIGLALRINLKQGKIVWGGSSLTQQLAKNLFLTPQKTFLRKLKEILITTKLEQTLTKNRILELYLNTAEWGPQIFGVAKASQYYFKKSPKELDAKEAAFLAAALPNPNLLQKGKIPKEFLAAGALLFERLLKN